MVSSPVSYSAVEHLATALWLGNWRDGNMLMLSAYFDETGSEPDPKSLVGGIAGCMASAGRWKPFERDWLGVLEKHRIKSPFHMKEFAHSFGQFADWKGNQPRRDELINDLWDVVERLNPWFVGCLIPLERYRTELTEALRVELIGMYHQTYVSCVAAIFWIIHSGFYKGLSPRVRMIFEYKEDVIKHALGMYEAIIQKSNNVYADIIEPPIFERKHSMVPLQLADVLAYECQKEFRRRLYNPSQLPRLGFRRLQAILDSHHGYAVPIGKTSSPIIFHSPDFVDDLKTLVPE